MDYSGYKPCKLYVPSVRTNLGPKTPRRNSLSGPPSWPGRGRNLAQALIPPRRTRSIERTWNIDLKTIVSDAPFPSIKRAMEMFTKDYNLFELGKLRGCLGLLTHAFIGQLISRRDGQPVTEAALFDVVTKMKKTMIRRNRLPEVARPLFNENELTQGFLSMYHEITSQEYPKEGQGFTTFAAYILSARITALSPADNDFCRRNPSFALRVLHPPDGDSSAKDIFQPYQPDPRATAQSTHAIFGSKLTLFAGTAAVMLQRGPWVVKEVEDVTSFADSVNGQTDSEVRCSICFEDETVCNSLVKTRVCGHAFCEQCILSWVHLRNSNQEEDADTSCPMCRQPLLVRSKWVPKWLQDPPPEFAATVENWAIWSELMYWAGRVLKDDLGGF